MFEAPRFTSQQDATSYGRLQRLLEQCTLDPRELIDADDQPETRQFVEELTRYVEARDIFIKGLFVAAQGHERQGIEAFIRSAQTSRHFTTVYAYCLGIAQAKAKNKPQEAHDLLTQLIAAQPDRPEAKDMLHQLFGR